MDNSSYFGLDWGGIEAEISPWSIRKRKMNCNRTLCHWATSADRAPDVSRTRDHSNIIHYSVGEVLIYNHQLFRLSTIIRIPYVPSFQCGISLRCYFVSLQVSYSHTSIQHDKISLRQSASACGVFLFTVNKVWKQSILSRQKVGLSGSSNFRCRAEFEISRMERTFQSLLQLSDMY